MSWMDDRNALKAARRDVAALEAEVERLLVEKAEAQAEVARLQGQREIRQAFTLSAMERLGEELDETRRENERLRAALAVYADEERSWAGDLLGGCMCWIGKIEEPWAIAREALATVGPAAPPPVPSGPESALREPEGTSREDAAFVAGYWAVFPESGAWVPKQSEVDAAHAAWVEGGRKTHLDEP